jgi:hypothetical protein
VDRAFGTGSCGHTGPGAAQAAFGPPQGPYAPRDPQSPVPGNPYGSPHGSPFGGEPPRPGGRGFRAGCAAALGLCCTCKVCCADEFEGPWSRRRREGLCRGDWDCDCCDVCGCCDCGNCDCGNCGCGGSHCGGCDTGCCDCGGCDGGCCDCCDCCSCCDC